MTTSEPLSQPGGARSSIPLGITAPALVPVPLPIKLPRQVWLPQGHVSESCDQERSSGIDLHSIAHHLCSAQQE